MLIRILQVNTEAESKYNFLTQPLYFAIAILKCCSILSLFVCLLIGLHNYSQGC